MSKMRMTRRAGILLGAAVGTLAITAAPASAAKMDYGVAPNTIPLTANDLRLMDQGNVDFIRLPFDWPSIQPAPGDCTAEGGACNWGNMDAMVLAADAAGIEVLPNINQSASFVNSNPFKPPTNDIAAWEDFVGALAQRYGPGGALPLQNPATQYQVWNEPGSNGDFDPKPNAKKYGKILKAAGNAIHGVNKKADVLVGGLFPDTGPKGIPGDKFVKDLYKVKKIEKSFDAVSVHPYSPNPKKGVVEQVQELRKAMNKAGDKKADIAVTELGYASGCPSCSKKNPPPVVVKNESKQKKALVQAFDALKKKKNKLNLSSITWFTWRDGEGPCAFCFTSGLIDENGNPKPAYSAFKKEAK